MHLASLRTNATRREKYRHATHITHLIVCALDRPCAPLIGPISLLRRLGQEECRYVSDDVPKITRIVSNVFDKSTPLSLLPRILGKAELSASGRS